MLLAIALDLRSWSQLENKILLLAVCTQLSLLEETAALDDLDHVTMDPGKTVVGNAIIILWPVLSYWQKTLAPHVPTNVQDTPQYPVLWASCQVEAIILTGLGLHPISFGLVLSDAHASQRALEKLCWILTKLLLCREHSSFPSACNHEWCPGLQERASLSPGLSL